MLLVLFVLVALALVPAAAQAQGGAAAPAGADGNGALPYWIVSEVAHGHGYVSPAGWQGMAAGATPTYYFYPDVGYHVDEVRVDGHRVRFCWDTYTFPPVYDNHTLSVSFAKNDYVITPSAGPHGWVFPATPQIVRAGSTPAFHFMPEHGYYAFGLSVDRMPVMFTAPNLFVFPPVYSDHWLHVSFMPTPAPAPLPKFVITPMVAGGQGAISPPTAQTVTKGMTPMFVFLPMVGWHVGSVTVDGVAVNTTGNTYTFPAVTANHTIAVTFVQDMLTITASVNGSGGTISPSGAQSVAFGSMPTFTFTPDAGYKTGTILVDGAAVSMSAPNQYTFSTVVTNHTISVSFTPDGGPVAGAMTVAAPSSASVKKGHTAALKYRVDQAILAGTADVTITIKNASGAVVNTQIRDGVPMNTLNTCKFRCKLDRGVYTFTVSARSAAGAASNTASNTLTVR
jgi:hypothetical protein